MQDIQEAELIGAYCDTTRRIVVISAFPMRLQTLLTELTTRCYDVLVFRHVEEALLSTLPIDLLIVDRTIAAVDPLSGLPEMKAPILYLVGGETALDSNPLHEHQAFWPTATEALMDTIETLAGKSVPQSTLDEAVFKDIRIDLKRIIVFKSGQRVDLTKTEFDLLRILLSSGGGVLSRQELMEKLWGGDYFGGSNSIDVHIKSLRRKLGDDPKNPRYIVTVRGIGYRTAE